MAHNVEPMDIDNIESDFDDKENSIHHSNVYARTPCTEKGYEELDVSELNMKLRYSITPAASPMSKSFTANCADSRGQESGDEPLNANLTRSLHSAFAKSDVMNKSLKMLPLQTLSSEQFVESNRNTSVLRPLDTTTVLDSNVTVKVTQMNDVDENLSCPSSSSSMAQTPEATTPTKDIYCADGGSPIMRGLKSVLYMFRSSQSPIPPADNADGPKQVLSPADTSISCAESSSVISEVLASTPIAAHKQKESSLSKRSSPLKESITFNEDLEKELLWKDETTILFRQEKIPIHKLFLQHSSSSKDNIKNETEKPTTLGTLNSSVEYMDISYNDSFVKNKTLTDLHTEVLNANESDAEFVDCETTFTNDKSNKEEQKHHNTDCELTSIVLTENSASSQKGVPDERSEKENSVLPQPSQTETVNSITADLIHDIPNCKEVEDNLLTNANVTANVKKDIDSDDDNNSINNVSSAGNIGGLDSTYGNLNIIGSTQDTNNFEEEPQPENETIKEPDFNMTNESETASSRDLDLINSYIIDSLTKEISESGILKLNLGATTGIKGNLTSEDKNDSVLLSCKASNTTATSEITAPVIIEELTNTVLPSAYNIPIDDKVEDDTFTKKIKCLSLPMNANSHTTVAAEIQETTFTRDTESKTMHGNNGNPKFGLEDENITDAAAPNSFLDINVLLPGESDLGGVNLSTISVEERLYVESTFDNPQSTESENIHCVEDMPIKSLVEAKLVNENTAINYSIIESNHSSHSFAINNEYKQSEIRDMNEVTEGILNCMTKEEYEIDEPLSKEIPIEISESIDNVHLVTDVQQAPLAEGMQLSLGISLEKIVDEHIDAAPTPTGDAHETCINIIQREINIEPETNENEVANIAKSSKMLETSQTESKLNETQADVIIDNTAIALQNLQDIKSVSNKTEIQSGILNETAVILDIKTDPSLLESNSSELKMEKATDVIRTNWLDVDENSFQIHSTSDDIHEEQPKLNRTSHNLKDAVNVVHEDTIYDVNIENKIQEVVEIQEKKIIMSEDHSPFVSRAAQNEQPRNLEGIEDPFKSKSKVLVTPPASPKIVSKGYNFNFDEIEDPFATKTKIRMSPTPEKPSKDINIFEDTTVTPQNDISKNRRKSKPDRKKPAMSKNKINSSFSGSVKTPLAAKKHLSEEIKTNCFVVGTENDYRETPEGKAEAKLTTPKKAFDISMNIDPVLEKSLQVKPLEIKEVPEETHSTVLRDVDLASKVPKEQKSIDDRDVDTASEVKVTEEIKPIMESFSAAFDQCKAMSSSEQSTYYSAGTSSGESNINRNVFNIPEIDDMNLNPFTTKSKMRVSPPPSLDLEFSKKDLTSSSVEDIPVDLDNFNPLVNESKISVSMQPSLEMENKIASLCESRINAASSGKTTEVGYFASKAHETLDDLECANVSNLTCSSKATDDKDITVREVHTEDEDTAEGPFLEADDDIDKISDFDGEDVDMMQFSELPPQTFEENQATGEMFIDAEAFEFLLNQNQSNVVSDSGKESLFLKFDPLFAKRVSTGGVLSALNKVQKRQSTPKKMPAAVNIDDTFEKAVAGPSSLNITDVAETTLDAEESTADLNITVSKPMMVVSPAVNPVITPRNKTTTPTSSNRRSITFTSPAIAVIDRLLSLSANNSLVSHDSSITNLSREQNEADLALTQLRELLAEKEISVYNLRSESKELRDRLSSLESQMKTLESESEQRLKKVNELNEKLSEKTKINKSMAAVVEEYERTIANLIDETEQDKKRHNEERIQLTKERDEQTAHLASMEVSFSDLHSKYVKSKQMILTCKANEDTCKKSIKEFEENLTKMQSNYELLKQHATSKLNHANQELEKMNRAHEAEVLKLNAMIKRKDLHITSLEETLAQKTKANEELSAICDELINKVG